MFSINPILQIQEITSAAADSFFKLMSGIGEELIVLLLISLIYWCFSKRKAFNLSIVYIGSVAVTFGVKKIVSAKRPPSELFNPAISQDMSASFPSGHANSAATALFGTTGGFFRTQKLWKLLTAILISTILVFLVGLARVYFGLHYVGDVLMGGILGAVIGFFGMWLMEKINIKEEWFALLLIPAVIMMCLFDSEEIFFMGGCFFALNIGYNLEKRFLKVEVPKHWFVKISRAIIGVGVTLALYFLFKLVPDLNELTQTQNSVYLFFMYFVIGMWVFLGAVFVFKFTDKPVLKFYNKFVVNIPTYVVQLCNSIKSLFNKDKFISDGNEEEKASSSVKDDVVESSGNVEESKENEVIQNGTVEQEYVEDNVVQLNGNIEGQISDEVIEDSDDSEKL